MRQLCRLTMASVVGVSSIFALNGSVQSARIPPLSAVLLGGNEVSATGTANAGDPDGVGGATIKITKLNNLSHLSELDRWLLLSLKPTKTEILPNNSVFVDEIA